MGNKAKPSADDVRAQTLQAMDVVIQGLQTGIWGIVSGYVEHPLVAASIMEGAVRLYLHALAIYHDKETAATYADRLITMLKPFASGHAEVSEETWFDSMTPPLLEQLSRIE